MHRFSPKGYTLVEMIIVIAIASVTLIAITAAIVVFYRANASTLAQAYAVQSARSGLSRIVATVRGMQYGADGSYPLSAVDPYTTTFYADVSGDGIPEKLRYFLSGTDLMEGITYSAGAPPVYDAGSETTRRLSDAVQNAAQAVPLFRYWNATGTELFAISLADPVAYVSVKLIVNENPAITLDYTLRSTGALRNVSQF